jgi:hypothetical protein
MDHEDKVKVWWQVGGWHLYSRMIMIESEWLLFNAKWATF